MAQSVVVDAIHTINCASTAACRGSATRTCSSRLWRARNRSGTTTMHDVPMLAAAYAFGLVRNHPYRDGNKRIGFLAMVTFLGLNGYDLAATDAEVVAEILAWPMELSPRTHLLIGFGNIVPTAVIQSEPQRSAIAFRESQRTTRLRHVLPPVARELPGVNGAGKEPRRARKRVQPSGAATHMMTSAAERRGAQHEFLEFRFGGT